MSYYSPSFANLNSGWYRVTDDENYSIARIEIDKIWTPACDEIITNYVKKYGSFYTAYENSLRRDIEKCTGKSFKDFRYDTYYFQNRVFELGLGDFLDRYYQTIKDKIFKCECCGKEERFIYVHPSAIRKLYPPRFCTSCFYLILPYLSSWTNEVRDAARLLLTSLDDERKCDICDRVYKLNNTELSVQNMFSPIVHVNIFSSFCPKCMDKIFLKVDNENENKNKQYKLLRELSNLIDKIPTQYYSDLFFLFQDREKLIKLAKILRKLWFPETFKKIDGSFFASLVYSGLLPEGSKRLKIGTLVLANDGHLCFSLIEKEIDDFLFKNDIKHDKEVKYPNSDYRCDWEIIFNNKRYFIEYFGLMNFDEYAKKAKLKKQIANDNNIELIEIYPQTNWSELFSDLFIKKNVAVKN